jgi:hypothetical protein
MKKKLTLSNDPDLFFHTQAADLISDQEHHTEGMREEFADDMLKGIHAGALHVYSQHNGVLRSFEVSWTGPFCVRPADVNDWLERKTQYKFRWNVDTENGATSPSSGTKPTQLPELETSLEVGILSHTIKTNRRHQLRPDIERAQALCKDPWDTTEVWAELSIFARKQDSQLFGATEDGLQYLKDGEVAIFTRNALQKRLKRASQNDRARADPIRATNRR